MATKWIIPLLAPALLACGIKEKIHEKIAEEVTEKTIEMAAEDGVEVELEDGKMVVEGKDGSVMRVDGEGGKVVVTDADDKTHVYTQEGEDAVRVQNSEGLDARMGKEIPADFPLKLPAVKEVVMGQRVEQPDGKTVFTVMMQASSADFEAIGKQLGDQLTAKGLAFEKNEAVMGPQKMLTLIAKDPARKIEVQCSVVQPEAGKEIVVNVTWAQS